MLPYADDTPSYSIPLWVILLIVLNVFVFTASYSGGGDTYVRTIFAYGCIPARFFDATDGLIELDEDIASLAASAEVNQEDWALPFVTLFTSVFLHGGIFHLLGNMWFLWLFGDNVEDRFGKLLFPFFYIICGLFAGLLHILFQPHSTVPAIGASGAIAGVMGAYIYLFPRATVATWTGSWYWGWVWHIPAPIYLGLWFVFQLIGGLAAGAASNVGFWAHVGGFVAGLLLAILLNVIGGINWYPGDRGYTGVRIRPLVTQPTVSSRPRRRRYTWRE